jgi:hypothetical protein
MSAMPPLITYADLEEVMGGPIALAQFCADDGSSVASTTIMDRIIQRASDEAGGLLLPAWSLDQIQKLVEDDEAVKGHIKDLAAGYAGRRKTAFMDQNTGRFPFDALLESGMKGLRMIAQRDKRAAGEEKRAGVNRTIGARTRILPRPKVFEKNKGGF